MMVSGISCYASMSGNVFDRLWRTALLGVCYVLVCSIHTSHASPASDLGRQLEVRAPYEKCFEKTCNRVTHYCDKNIQNCVLCEDDCHPSRIKGDESATKDCLKQCDWYYYIKSLQSTPDIKTTEAYKPAEAFKQEDVVQSPCSDAFLTIMVVATCFTILILIMLGVSVCCFKRLLSHTNESTATRETGNSFHSKVQLPPLTPSKGNENRETRIKLLANNDGIRTSQQESIQHSFHDQSINLSSARTNPNKTCNSQVHTNYIMSSRGQEDSSTQPLV